jgi:hypothetical protein
MTEAEWLVCAEPRKMLRYCERLLSDRKKRLYLVGCCRNVWDRMKNKRSRWAVVVAERFADRDASAEEMQQAYDTVRRVSDPLWQWTYRNLGHPQLERVQRVASALVGAANACSAIWATNAGPNIAWALGYEGSQPVLHEQGGQAAMIRCILGSPFRPISLSPSWLAWNDGTVRRLAEGIYNERSLPDGHLDLTRLAVLADALEDAGCADPELLGHLRGQGPHVRGCWAIDLLMGKE